MRAPGGTGDLDTLVLNAIVTKLKSATSAQRSALRDVLLHALLTKDLQLFTSADRVRDSLAGMNLNGQVLAPAGDSLEIVDTNLDGQPINASIAETATDTVTLDANGSALHALTLTYQYAKPTSLVSPPAYSDIVRVIVPNGAVGENIAKSCAPVQATQAFHRVLACAFMLAPGASVTLHFSWQVPHAWSNNGSAHHSYTLLLQRQPGASLGARVAVRAPAGRSFAAATAPGRLTSGQLTFEATPLLTDTTLQASF
jgi:hypothetical protein